MCLVLQGAPADGYNKSDNNQVAAQPATLGPEVTYSQIDAAAAASNTGPIHPQVWSRIPCSGILRYISEDRILRST